MIRALALLLPLLLAGCGGGTPAANQALPDANVAAARPSFDPPVPKNLPDIVRVRIETSLGAIVVALDHRHAPITVTNFVRYADDHRFDGTTFYRSVHTRGAPQEGFVQGGIAHSARLLLPPIRLEPTSETGLRHVSGTISMAHSTPDTAMGDFVLCIADQPGLDAHPGKGDKGYAVFGRVVAGIDVVRRIHAAPTVAVGGKPSERIAAPVRIVRVTRVA
ncbi:MAG TPA: peptidylprolyl isomerase [Allosphingosinicella sp.]|nr:peptidylprolyl isomerase [Allosphingosinicella sp.]